MKDLKIQMDSFNAYLVVGEIRATLYKSEKADVIQATLRSMHAAYTAHVGGVSSITLLDFTSHVHGILNAANWEGANRLLVSEVA